MSHRIVLKFNLECSKVPTMYTTQGISSVQVLSSVRLFATPCIAAHQASLSITNSQSLPKLMSIELVIPSISSPVIPFSSCPQPFSASVLPMNIQDWFPLRLTGLISLLSKGFSRVFSSTTIWKPRFFGIQPSLWSNSNIRTWLLENHSFD